MEYETARFYRKAAQSARDVERVARAFAWHRYFRFFLSLFFWTPPNEFFQIQRISLVSTVGFAGAQPEL
jgi:hypothetical protein